MGCYIAEYKPNISTLKNIVYILLILLIHTGVYWVINEGGRFYKPFLGKYQNILTMMLAVLIFILFYDKDITNKVIKKLIVLISTCSLDIYLFSYIIDLKIYSILKPMLETPKDHVMMMAPTVIIVFVLSFILAYLKNNLFELIQKNKKST